MVRPGDILFHHLFGSAGPVGPMTDCRGQSWQDNGHEEECGATESKYLSHYFNVSMNSCLSLVGDRQSGAGFQGRVVELVQMMSPDDRLQSVHVVLAARGV